MPNSEKKWGIQFSQEAFHVDGTVHKWIRDDAEAGGGTIALTSASNGHLSASAMDAKHIEAWGEEQPGNPSDMTCRRRARLHAHLPELG